MIIRYDESVIAICTAIVVEAHYDIQITNRPQSKHNLLTARFENKVDSASNNNFLFTWFTYYRLTLESFISTCPVSRHWPTSDTLDTFTPYINITFPSRDCLYLSTKIAISIPH